MCSRFFDPKDRRGRDRSKLSADELALRAIAWSGLARPTSLRHDAAEAILIGLWGVLEAGWLGRLSDALVTPPESRGDTSPISVGIGAKSVATYPSRVRGLVAPREERRKGTTL